MPKLVRFLVQVGFVMDMLRLWPRLFLSLYFAGGWLILRWYLGQSDAQTWDKSGFVTVYASVLLPMLKWYMENGVDWSVMLPLVVRRLRSREGAPCFDSKRDSPSPPCSP